MSFLKNVFGKEESLRSDSKVNWITLETISQLDEIITLSNEMNVLIFKHSTRCSVSRMVLKQFEKEFALQDIIRSYFLDLLEHRDISNEIASRFGIVHQSPQVIVIKEGRAVYKASHESIDAEELKKFI